jgi:hypothetical protein
VGDEVRFLRPDAIIEPLVDGFYAWMHTVTPVRAAVNLAFVQVHSPSRICSLSKCTSTPAATPAERQGSR